MLKLNFLLSRHSGEGRNPVDSTIAHAVGQNRGFVCFAEFFDCLDSGLRRNDGGFCNGTFGSNHTLIRFIFSATLLTLFHLNAYAAPGAVEVLSVAEREVVTLKNGKQVVLRAPVEKAVPGDEIIYTTTFKNLTAKPAAHIVITNPVPNDSLYKSGSAVGVNTLITFSVDGGKQFAASDKLFIKTKEGKTRPALPADYTHIRWNYQGDLGVGKAGAVAFRAGIK